MDDGPHAEDREQRISADPGMDVDVVMESIADSPLLADEDRRSWLALHDHHKQGGPEESKLPAVSKSRIKEDDDAVEDDLKDLLAVITTDLREEVKRNEDTIIATI